MCHILIYIKVSYWLFTLHS